MSIIGNPLLLGGGKSSVFAFIVVTYPEGSTLTATNGTKTLTAGDTSGVWVFEIQEAGTWTVTSTLGSDTATTDVLITSKGQSEGIELSYRLPSIYQEVEYLQSSGTQRIDTNTGTTGDLKTYGFEIDYQMVKTDTLNQQLFGTDATAQSKNLIRFQPLYTNYSIGFPYEQWVNLTNELKNADRHLVIVNKNGNYKVVVDNAEKSTISATSYTGNTFPFYVFDANNTPGTTKASAKLYSLKLYKDGALIADFIPCYRKSDSVAGLWDSKRKQFYTNAGTGTFIVGDPV